LGGASTAHSSSFARTTHARRTARRRPHRDRSDHQLRDRDHRPWTSPQSAPPRPDQPPGDAVDHTRS
jgi:hypothetical protein